MNQQKFDHRSDKRLITGVSGTGKTYLFRQQIFEERARNKFIYDHQGEFSLLHKKIQPVFDFEALTEQTFKSGLVVFDPVKLFPGKSQEGFKFFCDYVFTMSTQLKGRKILGCDELQKLTNTREDPQELLTILDTGRRYQIDIVCISQAPNRIHNGIRNQLTKIYTFRQSDQNAITFLSDNGFDGEKIRTLPRGKYLWRDLDSGESGEGGKEI